MLSEGPPIDMPRPGDERPAPSADSVPGSGEPGDGVSLFSSSASWLEDSFEVDEEGTYTSELDDAKRAILTCDKNASEWFQKERARMLASTMSADDKKEWSSRLDDDGAFYRVLVLEAKEKLHRAVETLVQKPST